MSRIDSGNESQDGSPDTTSSEPALLSPPKFSAALTQGKVIVRPVAFKPVTLPNPRFSNHGQRYGSTPILARPNSHLALYSSSNDLRQNLERKLAGSPTLAMSSLPSDCGRLGSYDSLDSVYKTSSLKPTRTRLMRSEDSASISDLTASPCDSNPIADLESALRERDSELQYLRQTMEHNEQVIFRVYQEKERAWEREIRRLKSVHETRLRASAQKALKLEQMLLMQTYQLQQDKKRLREDAERAEEESGIYRREVELLRTRLEEVEWSLCQKSGELALVKSTLKETQGDQTSKGQEVISLRNELRELKLTLEKKEDVIDRLMEQLKYDKSEITDSEDDERHNGFPEETNVESSDESSSEDEDEVEDNEKSVDIDDDEDAEDIDSLRQEVFQLKNSLLSERADWQKERERWSEEKDKVLTYQKQLQLNYVQMYKKTRTLEAEINTLRLQLDREAESKLLPTISLSEIQL